MTYQISNSPPDPYTSNCLWPSQTIATFILDLSKMGLLVYTHQNLSPGVSNFNKWHHYQPSCSSKKHRIGC